MKHRRDARLKNWIDLFLAMAGTLAIAALSVFGVPIAAAPQSRHEAMPQRQIDGGEKRKFEVASVKLGEPDSKRQTNFGWDLDDTTLPPGGRFFAVQPIEAYVEFAYQLTLAPQERQAMLADLPKWVATNIYVIDARAGGNPTKDEMRQMVQTLVADRFKLAVHFEHPVVQALAMVLAKPDESGPNIHPHGIPLVTFFHPFQVAHGRSPAERSKQE